MIKAGKFNRRGTVNNTTVSFSYAQSSTQRKDGFDTLTDIEYGNIDMYINETIKHTDIIIDLRTGQEFIVQSKKHDYIKRTSSFYVSCEVAD